MDVEIMKEFKDSWTNFHEHGYRVSLWKYLDPDDEFNIPIPQGFTIEMFGTRYPGSQVNTQISIPLDMLDELGELIKVMQEAQKALDAYCTLEGHSTTV